MKLHSVSKIIDRGYTAEFQKDQAKIINHEGAICIVAKRKTNLYLVEEINEPANFTIRKSKLQLWYERMGHLNEKNIKGNVQK